MEVMIQPNENVVVDSCGFDDCGIDGCGIDGCGIDL